MGQCGGPGRAEYQHGSQHLPSLGPTESPGHRLLGRPGRLHLKGKNKKLKDCLSRFTFFQVPLNVPTT